MVVVPAMILVICTANVCRSPMGEAILTSLLGERPRWTVRSAGVMAHDLPVDELAVEVMADRGLDISEHQPRVLTQEILSVDGAGLVLCMTRAHVREVVSSDPSSFARTFTLKELARRLAVFPGEQPTLADLHEGREASGLLGDSDADDVSDPYRLGLEEHRACADEIERACRLIAADLPLLLPSA